MTHTGGEFYPVVTPRLTISGEKSIMNGSYRLLETPIALFSGMFYLWSGQIQPFSHELHKHSCEPTNHPGTRETEAGGIARGQVVMASNGSIYRVSPPPLCSANAFILSTRVNV
jgi:hypothetical protein